MAGGRRPFAAYSEDEDIPATATSATRNAVNSVVDYMICPISQDIMDDPVVLSDGQSYEKRAILTWLQTNSTSPVTNLPISSQVYPNRALRDMIVAYKEGRLTEKKEMKQQHSNPPTIRPTFSNPVKVSEEAKAYAVKSEFACVYASCQLETINSTLAKGNIVLAEARYQVGQNFVVSMGNNNNNAAGFVLESDLLPIPMEKGRFVVKVVLNIFWRSHPTLNRPEILNGMASVGSVLSGTLLIKSPNGTTFYCIDRAGGERQRWLFDRYQEETLLQRVDVERRDASSHSPWVLESNHDLALRSQPDYSQDLRLETLVRTNQMVTSRMRVKGQHGDWFYWVKIAEAHGWIFTSRQGEHTMNCWPDQPKAPSATPGHGVQLCCNDEDEWVLVVDQENEDNEKSQDIFWSNSAPNSVCNQINNCIKKGRMVNGFAFGGNDTWYVSGRRKDGSGGFAWGNVDGLSCGAKVAIVSSFHFPSYAVCHERGGFNSQGVPSDMLGVMHRAQVINSIFFDDSGNYFVRYNGHKYSMNVYNQHFRTSINCKKGGKVCAVASFSYTGAWIVIKEHKFECSMSTPELLKTRLTEFYNKANEKFHRQNRRIKEYREAIAACPF
jgi:hypothetical protein